MAAMSIDAAIAKYAQRATDWKPEARVVDKRVYKTFHEAEPHCLSCGFRGYIHAHHLLHRSAGGDDCIENLVPLCSGCHEALHRINSGFVRHALGAYIVSERGVGALSYLRSKRSDGWIEKRFGVDLA